MTPTKRRAYAALAASTALLTLAACGDDDGGEQDAATSATPPATSATPSAPAESAPAGGAFRPGEYEATGTYTTPDGRTQSIEVEVDLTADGTITELDADGQAESGNSEQYQKKFESGIDAQVVGRKITELDVDKVSGSSLTSGGFNDAIEQIISQAKA
ncbi:FMN-binding protein [Aeromicrobium duanguangcaii]|uniref:FMN-binding protein n=1 Tax=Aeromicrobium duanguangcaii TaxID=2968086 RepID=A0ABY5KCR3_9ACTN|nr:FMN-binding protein [Aeromicrobium duanguangcaii]MCD9155099.1 FMN-binding protein [Aeromicrobium duanguangcaii]MCL3838445.1 FMN-binding protein [Aeromicrobium duanguangcaii]UUI68247.1 FMN-binding protein [Aeromicrobium duanguangcaii]